LDQRAAVPDEHASAAAGVDQHSASGPDECAAADLDQRAPAAAGVDQYSATVSNQYTAAGSNERAAALSDQCAAAAADLDQHSADSQITDGSEFRPGTDFGCPAF
jgi:hypothetical protein